MKAYIKRTLSGWIPADEETQKYHSKQSLGIICHFDIKAVKDQRNWKFLQKYWVMLSEVTANQERYRTKEDLHEAIKLELDIVDIREDMQGKRYKVVGSIAMDKMKQEEFERFYSDAINLILKYILTGTTEQELNDRVMELLSFS